MKKPTFSIIITTFNRGNLLTAAINSLVDQTLNDWELIIIDDGSTDNTQKIILPYTKDERIRYYYQENQERAVARNNGIKLAKGEYICFLDSDDFLLKNHLNVLFSEILKLNTPSKSVLVVDYLIQSPAGIKKMSSRVEICSEPKNPLIHYAILFNPPILTLCIPKSAFPKLKFKNDWLPYSECYQFSLDLLQMGFQYHFIGIPTVTIVQHSSNTTSYSKEFLLNRLAFITSSAKQIKQSKHPDIRKKSAELLLGIATFENQRQKRLKTAVEILKLNPKALGSRPFWGLIKRIIFS